MWAHALEKTNFKRSYYKKFKNSFIKLKKTLTADKITYSFPIYNIFSF
jgi:hypothetical protein